MSETRVRKTLISETISPKDSTDQLLTQVANKKNDKLREQEGALIAKKIKETEVSALIETFSNAGKTVKEITKKILDPAKLILKPYMTNNKLSFLEGDNNTSVSLTTPSDYAVAFLPVALAVLDEYLKGHTEEPYVARFRKEVVKFMKELPQAEKDELQKQLNTYFSVKHGKVKSAKGKHFLDACGGKDVDGTPRLGT